MISQNLCVVPAFVTICHVVVAALVVEETIYGMPYVKVISFPKDPEEKESWILAMPNEKESLSRLKEIYICEWMSVSGGKRPKEPPSVFPGVSISALKQMTSAPCPTSSSTSESRAKKMHAADEAAEKIQDFDHFCAEISSH